jgi:hypothetical protein
MRRQRLAYLAGLLTLGVLVSVVSPLLVHSTTVPAASAQQTEEETQLRELAERLVGQPTLGIAMPPSAARPVAHLLVGQLPSDLPLTIPTLPGGRLVGSLVRTGDLSYASSASHVVILDAPGTSGEVQGVYQQALQGQGWTATPFGPPLTAGFVTTQGSVSAFCPSSDRSWLMLAVSPGGAGASEVRLDIYNAAEGPCTAGLERPPTAPELERLPRLVAPAGVQLQPTSYPHGGPNRGTSEAVAVTGQNIVELDALFAQQLDAAGWTRRDGRAEGPLAWSTWQLPGPGNWEGWFFVLEGAGPNQRMLIVRVAAASTQ